MRILLVEDHADSADMLARLLRARGHEVEHAIDVRSATTAAESGNFDLVLCDLTLPDGNGRDLMRNLHARRGLRGVALSGHAETVGLDAGGGFVAHLTKPVEFPALLAILDKLSAEKRLHGGGNCRAALAEEETRLVAKPPRCILAAIGRLRRVLFISIVFVGCPGQATARRPSAGGAARGNQPRSMIYGGLPATRSHHSDGYAIPPWRRSCHFKTRLEKSDRMLFFAAECGKLIGRCGAARIRRDRRSDDIFSGHGLALTTLHEDRSTCPPDQHDASPLFKFR